MKRYLHIRLRVQIASDLAMRFFFGRKRTLPKTPWQVSDAVKMVFLTGLILFLASYGVLEACKWYFGEMETMMWMGDLQHLKYLVVIGLVLQVTVEMVLLYWYTRRKYHTTLADFGFRKTPLRSTIVLGIFLVLLVAVGQNIFIGIVDGLPGILDKFFDVPFHALSQSGEPENNLLKILIDQELLPLWALFLFAGVIAPITEELVFRGFLLPSVMEHMGYAWGIVIGSFIFAAVHLVFNPITLLIMFTIGVVLSVLYIRTQSLWPGIFFHMVNNTIGLSLMVWSF
jgi:membrane protease YdiL (CAAX protease family)